MAKDQRPQATRADESLTTHGKGIRGFWRIEGHPGIWVWRQKAKDGEPIRGDWVVATYRAYRGRAGVGVFSRELQLEEFFGLGDAK